MRNYLHKESCTRLLKIIPKIGNWVIPGPWVPLASPNMCAPLDVWQNIWKIASIRISKLQKVVHRNRVYSQGDKNSGKGNYKKSLLSDWLRLSKNIIANTL